MPLDVSEKAAAQIVPFLNAKNRSEKFLLFLLLLRLKCSKGRNVHGLLVASYHKDCSLALRENVWLFCFSYLSLAFSYFGQNNFNNEFLLKFRYSCS